MDFSRDIFIHSAPSSHTKQTSINAYAELDKASSFAKDQGMSFLEFRHKHLPLLTQAYEVSVSSSSQHPIGSPESSNPDNSKSAPCSHTEQTSINAYAELDKVSSSAKDQGISFLEFHHKHMPLLAQAYGVSVSSSSQHPSGSPESSNPDNSKSAPSSHTEQTSINAYAELDKTSSSAKDQGISFLEFRHKHMPLLAQAYGVSVSSSSRHPSGSPESSNPDNSKAADCREKM